MAGPDPLELLGRARRAVVQGRTWVSSHAQRRLAERGARIVDLHRVVLQGCVEQAEWDPEHRNWKLVLRGVDGEGDDLRIVCALATDEDSLTFVTLC